MDSVISPGICWNRCVARRLKWCSVRSSPPSACCFGCCWSQMSCLCWRQQHRRLSSLMTRHWCWIGRGLSSLYGGSSTSQSSCSQSGKNWIPILGFLREQLVGYHNLMTNDVRTSSQNLWRSPHSLNFYKNSQRPNLHSLFALDQLSGSTSFSGLRILENHLVFLVQQIFVYWPVQYDQLDF